MRSLIVSAFFLAAMPGTALASDMIVRHGGPLCPTYTSANEADDLFVATHDFQHFPQACIVVDAGTVVQPIDSISGPFDVWKVFYKGSFWWTTSRFASYAG